MQTVNVAASGGATVFWDAGVTDRELLEQRLTALGLGDYAPKPRTDTAALKGALVEYVASIKPRRRQKGDVHREKLVQPLDNQETNGFEVVDCERGQTRNFYTADFTAKVDGGVVSVNGGYADGRSLQQTFATLKAQVDGQTLGRCLTDIVDSLGGVVLRPSGGLYWLPESGVYTWNLVADAVQAAGPKNYVYCMRTIMDAGTVRAVRDAIVSEVSQAAKQLQDEVAAGDLGENALMNRINRGVALHQRVKEYESLLNSTLTDLHTVIAISEQAAAAAIAVKNTNEVYEEMYS